MSVVTYIHATVRIPRIIGVKTTISAQKIIGCFVLKFFGILLWLLRLYGRLALPPFLPPALLPAPLPALLPAPLPAPLPASLPAALPAPALLIVRLVLEECEFRP